MSRSVNNVTLLGHLGKDCEVRYTPSGVACGTFSIATSRRWKDKESGEWKEETDWHNVVYWRCENVAQFLVKGTQVYVSGRLQTRSYEKDGGKRYVTEVICEALVLCGGGPARPAAEVKSAAEPAPAGGAGAITDDDVPF